MMILELVLDSVAWINSFPPKGDVRSMLSPRTLFTSMNMDYTKHCKIKFGTYAQVHEEPQPMNSLAPQTTGAIALGSMFNAQGGYKFMSLNTGH